MDKMTVSQQLQEALEERLLVSNQKEIAEESGLDPSQISRLVNGIRGIRLDTLDKLCHYLDLELKPIEPRTSKK